MDAYEVHKKIQEAIMALEIYQLSSFVRSPMWHSEIMNGLEHMEKQRQELLAGSAAASEIHISRI